MPRVLCSNDGDRHFRRRLRQYRRVTGNLSLHDRQVAVRTSRTFICVWHGSMIVIRANGAVCVIIVARQVVHSRHFDGWSRMAGDAARHNRLSRHKGDGHQGQKAPNDKHLVCLTRNPKEINTMRGYHQIVKSGSGHVCNRFFDPCSVGRAAVRRSGGQAF